MDGIEYFIERIDTNEWLTMQTASKAIFWTKDPQIAWAFSSRSEAWRVIEREKLVYDYHDILKGIETTVTEHEFVNQPPPK